jgi:hypothetical protein
MKRTEPPFIATWILERLTPGNSNDALLGDLLEEFRSGRSAGWYWRQVLAAVANGCFREMRVHWLVVVFAALWVIPAQAWWSFASWFAIHCAGLIVPWPYSNMIGMAVVIFESLWAGLAFYALLASFFGRDVTLEGIRRGVWIGPLVFSFLTVAIQILSHPLGIPPADRGALKLATYFLSMAVAAWRVRSRVAPESKATDCPAR